MIISKDKQINKIYIIRNWNYLNKKMLTREIIQSVINYALKLRQFLKEKKMLKNYLNKYFLP